MKKVISIIVYVGIIPGNLSYENLARNTVKIFNIKVGVVDNTFLMKWLNSLTGQYFIKGNISCATLGKLALNRIYYRETAIL
ncbi:hypothetical protein [Clostridium botulinum]|uniref:Uncharacterized protein n=1 Tax=Clostridium botulinum TaxID=1491 RepID=A0ABD7CPV8_CLOBO|nr:hypothetical protein [Clostridium botulinum]KGO13655.1 hypothetical protein NZ45_11545 [Clostridium botulinum]KIN80379.1 hypothetical protein SD74_15645 [Clostridium botulinum]MCC5426058.1 hypothetical protein [Clostridium botulinum]QRI55455.1 hypothetical protein JQS73_03900 [Clostridium botulinum]